MPSQKKNIYIYYLYANVISIHPFANLLLRFSLRIHTRSIRKLKLDVPMTTQIRHCKKELLPHHWAGGLEVAVDLHLLQPMVSQLPNPATCPAAKVSLCPFFFLLLLSPGSFLGISCLKSHTSSFP